MSVQVIGSGTIGGIDEGLVVSGIVTVTELDISGNIDVDGHTNLDNVSVSGATTCTGGAVFLNSISLNASTNNYLYFNDNLNFTRNGHGNEMTIDSSGRVLIGTTTAGTGSGDDLTISNSSNMGLTLRSTSSNYCNIYFSDATSGTATYEGYISYNHATDSLEFATGHTERLRIDSSGHLHTGYTSSFGADHVNILATDGGGISIAQNNSGNATSGTVLGSLSIQGYLNTQTHANAEVKISGIAAANHTGSSAATDMVFYTKPSTTGPGSAPTERVKIKSDGGLVSSKGGTLPFSDGYSALEARAPEGTTQLTVTNTTYESGTFDNEAGIWFKGNYSGNNERAKSAIIHKNTGDYGIGDLYFCIDGNADNSNAAIGDVKMKISSTGQVTTPNQPSFMANFGGNNNVSHNNGDYLKANSTDHNTGNCYNTGNYRFTAPVAGNYLFYGRANMSGATTNEYARSFQVRLYKNNSSEQFHMSRTTLTGYSGSYPDTSTMVCSINLAANDYVQLKVNWETDGNGISSTENLHHHGSMFGGYLIG